MIDDAEESKPRSGKLDFDRMSIAELEARIAELEAEIAACREAIGRKRGHLSAADRFFRR